MCGIYGMLAREGAVDSMALPAMDTSMRHRGPDDSGTLLDGPCGIGMRRLSIIDLDGGKQPIPNEDRSVWVVFNGEIYNFRALRKGLQHKGHRFTTSSDTEVIVHLYEDHGADFVKHLRGMFAVAVWDRRQQLLTLARDHLGIKPLYYAETSVGLLFASELKSLLVHPSVSKEIDPLALSHYLSFNTTPADRGFVQGVKKLPAAHVLQARNGRVINVKRYWDLRPAPSALSEDDAIENVRALITDAVKSHLESDVPVGAFLSGGVDSATVVAQMARLGQRPYTFSIGWGESDFDELVFARKVAERYGTKHEELVVRPDVWNLLGEIVPFLDEPFGDASAVPTYLVSKLAAEKVKVVLSGDGGDEVFGGYDHYAQGLADARRFDRLPAAARKAMGLAASLLPDVAPGKNWLRHASLSSRVRFLEHESLFASDAKLRLMTPGLRARLYDAEALLDPVEERAQLLDGAPGDALSRLLYLDTMTYLPMDILTKVDRMSMAHSLEVRPPLLDKPLVEAVAAMPSKWKVNGEGRKILMKKAVRDWVPHEIINRAKKGFGVPIRDWFRGPLKNAVSDVLLDRRTTERGLFDARYVRGLLDEHRSGRRDQSMRLWSLLVLELWTRSALEGGARAGQNEARSPELSSVAPVAQLVAIESAQVEQAAPARAQAEPIAEVQVA